MAKANQKQRIDELEFYTDFEALEVRLDELRENAELMDCSDEALEERDYLDTMEFCMELNANEFIDDDNFNYMEI
tara:strand:- start:224 stop:448 length:225 start_codon:yes stop_codon:yes gene_type:complete